MNNSKENLKYSEVLIIGSGIIGKFNALELSRLGFQVSIIDPCQISNSSNAALGILMGKTYQKRIGRSWELRKKSIKLWPKWLKEFQNINPQVIFEKPLIKTTTNGESFEKMKNFVLKHPNDNLEILNNSSIFLNSINNVFCRNKIQGIISHEDGRINPKTLLNTIDVLLNSKNIKTINDTVVSVRKNKEDWISTLKGGNDIVSKVVILCNSLNALKIIKNNKYNLRLQPVTGQAVEICVNDNSTNFLTLPKVFNINQKNIIPLSKNKLIIGSTDEYQDKPQEELIESLINFVEYKPKWLNAKNISKKWFGVRSKPVGEGSPILKVLEKGLILCTGFYKNGILLAPACSQWVSKEIKNHI